MLIIGACENRYTVKIPSSCYNTPSPPENRHLTALEPKMQTIDFLTELAWFAWFSKLPHNTHKPLRKKCFYATDKENSFVLLLSQIPAPREDEKAVPAEKKMDGCSLGLERRTQKMLSVEMADLGLQLPESLHTICMTKF